MSPTRPGARLGYLALSAVSILFTACGGRGNQTTPTQPASPTPVAQQVTVKGTVTSRIDNSFVDGSVLSLQPAGSQGSAKEGLVAQGRFEIAGVSSGQYTVVITGNSHVTATFQNVTVGSGPVVDLTFTVLKWGSQRFGATYDEHFDQFFNWIARTANGGLIKWDLKAQAPREFYVATQEAGTSTPLDAAFVDYMVGLVREVNTRAFADMFCGQVGEIPVRTGPTRCPVVPCPNPASDGQILIEFGRGMVVNMGGPQLRGTPAVAYAADVWLRLENYLDDGHWKYDDRYPHWPTPGWDSHPLSPRWYDLRVLGHEIFHGAYANHPTGTYDKKYYDSLMSGASETGLLSRNDQLASCLAYHSDTGQGSKPPDINIVR